MEIIETGIAGLLLIRPRIFGDERGYFFESFNEQAFAAATGVSVHFVQDNQSMSAKNVLRGLHLQAPPYAQGKLVRVVTGSVLDVAVDIRKNSATYGKCFAAELNAENKLMMWIPPGFAHGFSVLEDQTVFLYKCTGFYNKSSEQCIRWNDPDLNIQWKISDPVISDKDQQGVFFRDFVTPFEQ